MGDNCIFPGNSNIFMSSNNGWRIAQVIIIFFFTKYTVINFRLQFFLIRFILILRLRNEIPIKRAGEKSCTTQFSFKKRDGSEMIIPIRSGLHSVNLKVYFLLNIFFPLFFFRLCQRQLGSFLIMFIIC